MPSFESFINIYEDVVFQQSPFPTRSYLYRCFVTFASSLMLLHLLAKYM